MDGLAATVTMSCHMCDVILEYQVCLCASICIGCSTLDYTHGFVCGAVQAFVTAVSSFKIDEAMPDLVRKSIFPETLGSCMIWWAAGTLTTTNSLVRGSASLSSFQTALQGDTGHRIWSSFGLAN